MSDVSKIEWTDATWNPTRGCRKVSPGCKNCYAATFAERFRGVKGHAYERGFDPRMAPDALELPLRWKRPRHVFVDSMSDLFLEDFEDAYIAEVFGVMAVAGASEPSERESAQVQAGGGGAFHGPGDGHELIDGGPYRYPRFGHGPHTFQILTKRADRMCRLLTDYRFREKVAGAAYRWAHDRRDAGYLADCISASDSPCAPGRAGRMWPLSNVWMGVSVENQAAADKRIPRLLATPAAVRFLSCEPLLGEVDLTEYLHPSALVRAVTHHHRTNHVCGGAGDGADCMECGARWENGSAGLGWVIAGAESGPKARHMNEDWVRALRDQCVGAGVPFFYKQRIDGGRKVSTPMLDGRRWTEMPKETR